VGDKKLNILFLSGWYPNRVHPTLGNFIQKHAEAVALRSNVIALNVCSDAGCKQTYEITDSVINNVRAINVYYKKVTHGIPVLSQIQKLIRTRKAYSKGLRIVKSAFGRIDLVHHNILYPSGLIALQLKRSMGIPYIVTEHSTEYLSSKNLNIGSNERMLSKKIARNASFITPVSKDLRDAMMNLGLAGNYEVVYNVVDTKLFYPSEQKTGSKIKFLHVSTLDDDHKNISGMLRSIAELSKQRTDFEFWVVGDGDTAPHIETAKKLGIYNSVVFFDGTKTTSEIADLMRSSDCFVLFSNYENLPVVIIEALASGLPVVSSDVGGIHEHINAERGVLVPHKNEKVLTMALDQMANDIRNKRYDAARLSRYADENFSYEKVSEKFHHLYQRILKDHV
jgi:glycosyltransferase involved in cell wall biosynthesis